MANYTEYTLDLTKFCCVSGVFVADAPALSDAIAYLQENLGERFSLEETNPISVERYITYNGIKIAKIGWYQGYSSGYRLDALTYPTGDRLDLLAGFSSNKMIVRLYDANILAVYIGATIDKTQIFTKAGTVGKYVFINLNTYNYYFIENNGDHAYTYYNIATEQFYTMYPNGTETREYSVTELTYGKMVNTQNSYVDNLVLVTKAPSAPDPSGEVLKTTSANILILPNGTSDDCLVGVLV